MPGALRLAAARPERRGFAARPGTRRGLRRAGLAADRTPDPGAAARFRVARPVAMGGRRRGVRGAAGGRRSWRAASIRSRASPRRWPRPTPQAGERVLLVAVGDYLERSQMVLFELANANPKDPLDISAEQERAGRPGQRKPPVPPDRRAHRRYRRRRRPGRPRPRAARNHARAVQDDPGRVAKIAPAAGSRRHSLQDPRSGLQRPEPGRIRPGRSPVRRAPKTLTRQEMTLTSNIHTDFSSCSPAPPPRSRPARLRRPRRSRRVQSAAARAGSSRLADAGAHARTPRLRCLRCRRDGADAGSGDGPDPLAGRRSHRDPMHRRPASTRPRTPPDAADAAHASTRTASSSCRTSSIGRPARFKFDFDFSDMNDKIAWPAIAWPT